MRELIIVLCIISPSLAFGQNYATIKPVPVYETVRPVPVKVAVYSAPQQQQRGSYPTRSANWTYPGSSRADLIRHLQSGEHRGKFSREYLESLSHAELEALHSDDHEHRVRWQRVNGTPQVAASRRESPPRQKPSLFTRLFGVQTYSGSCPGGVCPRE